MNGKIGLFRLGGYGFAVPLNRLLRVVDRGCFAPLPLIPDGMVGMLIHDGEIIPLLDSNWLPGVADGKAPNAGFKILIATEYGPIALPAETTVGIVAGNRCQPVVLEQETADFFPDTVSYRDKCYQVLNVDIFMMSLIRS